ncbi:alpha-ribazole phosphatase [Wohlfahrtiimonas larvae]|uniref:Alpha-ribazole phosphatase n=1 Tax=Wohlfahrtiimonas larvae TaxID=1157986 RepID=A0ABP9MX90_9GAMM|nr:alpha-ribazole phosphatase [Wohlfahrtiimonas larvae]
MKLILIRHTSLNIASGICYGQSDIDVSSTFINEADIIKTQLSDYQFDATYTSPLQRCVKLANFCGFPDAIQTPQLMELNFGDWEGKLWDDINDPNLQNWFNDWLHIPATNGESFIMQYQRYVEFVEAIKIKHADQTIALFTHGGILHCARIHAGLDQFDNTFEHKPAYGEILTINL